MKVELIDHMGSDLSVVNAARVSFDKESGPLLSDKDAGLIRYLAKHKHWTPFGHPHVTFRLKAPIFVARQLGKHQVGMVWSEVSRRYVDSEPEFYTPPVWRKRAADVKQGSSDETVELQEHYGLDKANMDVQLKYLLNDAQGVYRRLVAIGCCPEQARMVLPQSMMTEWIWTGSLYGWANVYNQRKPGSHAQRETWEIAKMIDEHMSRLFPVSWEALTR